MKARPIKRRNVPIEYPVLAEWVDDPEGINLIVLFTQDRIGYKIRHSPDYHCGTLNGLSGDWISLSHKNRWNRWKILGTPEQFGLSLVDGKIIGELNL